MRTISQRELRNDSAQVLRDLSEGEDMIVTRNGQAIGILRMLPAPVPEGPQRFVSAERAARMHGEAPMSDETRQRWLAELDEPHDDEVERVSQTVQTTAQSVRAWAADAGVTVAPRGRMPHEVTGSVGAPAAQPTEISAVLHALTEELDAARAHVEQLMGIRS